MPRRRHGYARNEPVQSRDAAPGPWGDPGPRRPLGGSASQRVFLQRSARGAGSFRPGERGDLTAQPATVMRPGISVIRRYRRLAWPCHRPPRPYRSPPPADQPAPAWRQAAGGGCVRFTIGLNYCDRLRSLSIVYERFALCKDNCTQRVRGPRGGGRDLADPPISASSPRSARTAELAPNMGAQGACTCPRQETAGARNGEHVHGPGTGRVEVSA
jgi:hypothetical protein